MAEIGSGKKGRDLYESVQQDDEGNVVSKRAYLSDSEEGDKKFVLLKQMVIKAGTLFSRGPSRVKYVERHYEFIIGLGTDHCAYLIVPESALEAMKEFTELKE